MEPSEMMRNAIKRMEQQNPVLTYFESGFIEAGFDNYQSPMRTAMSKLEQLQ
jgi:hypothetical protein